MADRGVAFHKHLGFRRQSLREPQEGGRRAPGERRATFTQILVPLDLTQKNKAALEAALSLAHENRAETTLLHVVRAFDGPGNGTGSLGEIEATAREAVRQRAKAFRKKGLVVHEKVVYGQPVTEILEHAKRIGADLIVLSSHRVTPKRPYQDWGTVSYKVACYCQCPVLLTK